MRTRTWPVPAILAVLLTGCANGAAEPVPPPPDAAFDYQLGGAYEPAAGVEIVVRDRTASPHPDLYSVCYVNAFQTQPGDEDATESFKALCARPGTPRAAIVRDRDLTRPGDSAYVRGTC